MPDSIRHGGSRSILIADGIRSAAFRTPDKIAITEGERSLSYRRLVERIDRVSHLAVGLGLKRGDLVAIQCRNRIEYLELVAGLSGPSLDMILIRAMCMQCLPALQV